MKKIILSFSLFIFMIAVQPANALTVKVSSMANFTTESPSQTLKVMTLEAVDLKNGTIIPEGTIIKGEIFDVRPPMRGKLNAGFKFKPLYYSYNGQKVMINSEEIIAKYAPYKELDKGELAVSAASTAGSMILKIPGFGEAVSFVKGAAKNPEGNRLKSGAKQIYKDSFLSYVEEGKEVVIKKDEMFLLKFKLKNEPDEEVTPAQDDSKPASDVPINTTPQENKAPTAAVQNESKTEENSAIHPVDPYDVLKEVEESKK